MPTLPNPDAKYPVHNTGPQSASAPAPEPVDLTMVDLLRRMHIEDPELVAGVLQSNGYARPEPVADLLALAGLPPQAMLWDKDGSPWSAASISEEDFTRWGPWHLVAKPRPGAILTEESTD